jgi:hypothetical protein
MWDVETSTFFRKLAHRCWWGCKPYAGHHLFPMKIPLQTSVRGWVDPRTITQLAERIRGTWNCDLLMSSLVLQSFYNRKRHKSKHLFCKILKKWFCLSKHQAASWVNVISTATSHGSDDQWCWIQVSVGSKTVSPAQRSDQLRDLRSPLFNGRKKRFLPGG